MTELLLFLILAQNPACKAENKEFWNFDYNAIVGSQQVPQGKVWLVRAAGLFTNDSTGAMYALEIVRRVRSQQNACCWVIPVVKMQFANTTPLLALERPIVLHEGEQIRGRSTIYHAFGINGVYYELPKQCLE